MMQVLTHARIRRASLSEWGRLAELMEDVVRTSRVDVDPSYFSRGDGSAHIQYQIEKGNVLVIDSDDGLTGFCQFAVNDGRAYQPNRGRSLEMRILYVQPDQRGKGLGRALVAEFLAEAQRRNIPRVTVSMPSNMEIDRLLLSQGFAESRREYDLAA